MRQDAHKARRDVLHVPCRLLVRGAISTLLALAPREAALRQASIAAAAIAAAAAKQWQHL